MFISYLQEADVPCRMFNIVLRPNELTNGNYNTNHFIFVRKWDKTSGETVSVQETHTQPREDERSAGTISDSLRNLFGRLIRNGQNQRDQDLEANNLMLPPQPEPTPVNPATNVEPSVEVGSRGYTKGHCYIKQAYLSLNGKGLQSTSMVNATENDCAEEYINFARTTGCISTGNIQTF